MRSRIEDANQSRCPTTNLERMFLLFLAEGLSFCCPHTLEFFPLELSSVGFNFGHSIHPAYKLVILCFAERNLFHRVSQLDLSKRALE